MRIVRVKFLNTIDKDYAEGFFYKDSLSRKLQKYDTVVVPTRYGLSMAVVDQVNVNQDGLGFDIGRIKTVAEKIKSKAVDDQTRLQKADDITKALDKAIKEVDAVEKYRVYAGLSPEVAKLLTELEELKA